MTPALIAIDWGTSSFRAWALDAGGGVLDSTDAGPGIMAVSPGGFEAAFRAALGPWLAPGIPVIASGMITSRNGWVETPYLPLPSDPRALARALTPLQLADGITVNFVTGVKRVGVGTRLPDVMRGEETEIAGYGAVDGLFLLPGTHSKWAWVAAGRLVDFQTVMTGEAFALLRQQSILGRLAADGPFQAGAFARGLAAGRAGGALLARAFSARSLALVGDLAGADVNDYISGLLIGDEVAGMAPAGGTVTIIGRGDLAERYRLALEAAGVGSVVAEPGMARAGLWTIARQAGLIP